MKRIKPQAYRDEFPLKIALLGKEYDIDFVSENRYKLVVCVGHKNNVVLNYVFVKDGDGYVNMINYRNLLCRNLEGHMYWKEVQECGIEEDDRVHVYNKWRRKGTILDTNSK